MQCVKLMDWLIVWLCEANGLYKLFVGGSWGGGGGGGGYNWLQIEIGTQFTNPSATLDKFYYTYISQSCSCDHKTPELPPAALSQTHPFLYSISSYKVLQIVTQRDIEWRDHIMLL